jgi:hypothetical protein
MRGVDEQFVELGSWKATIILVAPEAFAVENNNIGVKEAFSERGKDGMCARTFGKGTGI